MFQKYVIAACITCMGFSFRASSADACSDLFLFPKNRQDMRFPMSPCALRIKVNELLQQLLSDRESHPIFGFSYCTHDEFFR